MATPSYSMTMPAWVTQIMGYRALVVPFAVIGLLAVLIVPMPTFAMDLLIAANLALAAVILLTTIFVTSPLEFSVFPSLLLGTTLFRLVLNVATTRLILQADAATPEAAASVAGDLIFAFSNFVAGNSLVVGLILFIILIVVQFVVITKGATRISEVAARFTLDGMPGKQMAIDADLNAGLINEHEARTRRDSISREADFYGAMDGAAKFVRGDAIAGIIITVINILGGFTVGMAIKGWGFTESLELFTMLTIGDGLVSQLPALIISIAAGLIVTRSSGEANLGTDLSGQLTRSWQALAITACFLFLMAFTGMPVIPMLALAIGLGTVAWYVRNTEINEEGQVVAEAARKEKADKKEPPPIEQSMAVDALELEVGYALVALVDAGQGGNLLERISMIRRQLATELGLVMPPVRIRDNMQLEPNHYNINIRGNLVASGTIYPDQYLAMDGGLASEPVEGRRVREPAFGLDATWIDPAMKEHAESLNYAVVGATDVLATHLTEVVKDHGYELLTREETNNLIKQVQEKAPKLVEEVLGENGILKPGQLQKVLQNLLRERVPIRDLETIIETLGDWGARSKDLEVLTEYVRNALRRTITNQHVSEEEEMDGSDVTATRKVRKLYCVSLDPSLEDMINGFIDRTTEGTSMSMPPAVANRVVKAISTEVQKLLQAGRQPVVLASPQVRGQGRKLIETSLPNVAVVGYNEVSKGVEVESLGLVQLEQEPVGAGAAN